MNIATIARKELHPEKGTPLLVPTPAIDSYMQTVSSLTPNRNSGIVM